MSTALIITGAAARITQELALIEELYNRGEFNKLEFISGVSSGAINAIALNGILENKISWAEYKELFLNISNSNIYRFGKNKLPVDTAPLRQLLEQFVEIKLGYTTISSLPIATAISITHHNALFLENKIFRISNREIGSEYDPGLRLVDILMATTALPVIFPPVTISGSPTIPPYKYYDGGIGEDFVPYQSLFMYERYVNHKIDKVFIVSSKKAAGEPEISEELKIFGIDDHQILDQLGFSLDKLFKRTFDNELTRLKGISPDRAANIFVWTPQFKEDFPFISFEKLRPQYFAAIEWAKNNEPVALSKLKI